MATNQSIKPATFRPARSRIHRICDYCHAGFFALRKDVDRGDGKCCSRAHTQAYKKAHLADRFWAKVNKSEACWLWTGVRDGRGYGQFYVGTPVKAHASRVSWELHHGPIPQGLHVLHHCDNPPCVRPDHLFLGTRSDNAQDMHAKGRYSRSVYVTHEGRRMTLTQFADVIGVNRSTVKDQYRKQRLPIEEIVARSKKQ